MTCKQLRELLKARGLKLSGRKEVLIDRLLGREQDDKADWIKWNKSVPQRIILNDLVRGALPLDEEGLSAVDAWEFYYSNRPEFVDVVFRQFEARLKDHRKQVKRDRLRAEQEYNMMCHDRALHQRPIVNHRGEPVYDLHPAKVLLREDVENGRHLGIAPKDFWLTRPEYQEFELKSFRHRIYQEIRRKKYITYLNDKREED